MALVYIWKHFTADFLSFYYAESLFFKTIWVSETKNAKIVLESIVSQSKSAMTFHGWISPLARCSLCSLTQWSWSVVTAWHNISHNVSAIGILITEGETSEIGKWEQNWSDQSKREKGEKEKKTMWKLHLIRTLNSSLVQVTQVEKELNFYPIKRHSLLSREDGG